MSIFFITFSFCVKQGVRLHVVYTSTRKLLDNVNLSNKTISMTI